MPHTTRHGNTYTDQEWQEMKSQFKAEEKARSEIEARIDGMIKYLVRKCVEFGFNSEQAQKIAHLFRTAEYLEADIQFSSKKNQVFVENMWTRFDKAMSELS